MTHQERLAKFQQDTIRRQQIIEDSKVRQQLVLAEIEKATAQVEAIAASRARAIKASQERLAARAK